MPYVQESEIAKYHQGSFEDKIQSLHSAVESAHGKKIRMLATHVEHALVVDEDGKFLRADFLAGKKGLKVEVSDAGISVVDEADLPVFVSREIREIVEAGMSGEAPDRTRVRSLFGLLERDEQYWLTDVLAKLDEVISADSDWLSEDAPEGEPSALAQRIPTTRYTKLPDGRLSEFTDELADSMTILAEVFASVVDETTALVFDEEEDTGRSAVRKSLIAEAQAANSLLVKAEKLMSSKDAERTAEAHDKLAERATKMAAVSASLRALNDDEE